MRMASARASSTPSLEEDAIDDRVGGAHPAGKFIGRAGASLVGGLRTGNQAKSCHFRVSKGCECGSVGGSGLIW